LRAAAPFLVGAGSREAQARAQRLPRLPPRARPGSERQGRRFPARCRRRRVLPARRAGRDRHAAARRAPVGARGVRLRVPAPDPGLFKLQTTGASPRQTTDAARAFVDSLSEPQRERALFPLESDAWRRWSNIHPYLMRHGLSLDEMSPAQRDRALALVRESLSTQGFKTARDVMRLNELVLAI